LSKITICPNGIKGAVAAGMNKNPPKRGTVKGWTAATARRNRDFLMSIDASNLTGKAVSASLTFGRDVKITPDFLTKIRDMFIMRLRRMDLIRAHWVVEFQRDGTPHLHLMAFFPDQHSSEVAANNVAAHWLALVASTGAEWRGQHVVPSHKLLGWIQYLAKHGARSAQHYQRGKLPEGWEQPGRMWGKVGDWPVGAFAIDTDRALFWAIRRFVRSWRVADARKALKACPVNSGARAGAIKRLQSARAMLACNDKSRSEMRGFAEWVPEAEAVRMVQHLSKLHMARDWEDRLSPLPCPIPQQSLRGSEGGKAPSL